MRIIFFLLFSFSLSAATLTLKSQHLDAPLMQFLITSFGVDTLVETGTWVGDTAVLSSRYFKEVYTVELGHIPFLDAQKRLKSLSNVHAAEGDSPTFLAEVIPAIRGKILFWLDAHWCSGDSANTMPIREELEAIRQSGLKEGVILIDDIRHFHNLPPDYPEYGKYPSLKWIQQKILEINPAYQFWILGDMAIAYLGDAATPSELVKACTISRLFGEGDSIDAVLTAEKTIRRFANLPESREFDKLMYFVRADPTEGAITVHLLLWKGLIEMGKSHFWEASQIFQRVRALGYPHWRVDWYLADCLFRLGDHEAARELAERILQIVPNFFEAKRLLR